MVKSLTNQISKSSSKHGSCCTILTQAMEGTSLESGSFTRDSDSFCNKTNSTFTIDFPETAKGVNQCSIWTYLFINNFGRKQALRWHEAADKKLSYIPCWGSLAPGQECKGNFPCHTKGSIHQLPWLLFRLIPGKPHAKGKFARYWERLPKPVNHEWQCLKWTQTVPDKEELFNAPYPYRVQSSIGSSDKYKTKLHLKWKAYPIYD